MNVITSLLGLIIVSHLSPKGSGRLKGKCALGPFLSILVIQCLTQVPNCKMG
jgi:hypothetical protein